MRGLWAIDHLSKGFMLFCGLALAACTDIPLPLQKSDLTAPAAIAVSAPPQSDRTKLVTGDTAALSGTFRLVGLTDQEIDTMLGRPTLRRTEHPAQVWQYRGGECVLFLFFYDSDKGNIATVAYVEARNRRDALPIPDSDCIKTVRDLRAQKGPVD